MKSQGFIPTAQNVDYDDGSQPASLATGIEGQSQQMAQPASLNNMTSSVDQAKRMKPKTADAHRRHRLRNQSNM